MVANLDRVQMNEDNDFSLYPFALENCWSRETGTAVPSRVSLRILHTQAGSGAYSRDSSHCLRQRPHMTFN